MYTSQYKKKTLTTGFVVLDHKYNLLSYIFTPLFKIKLTNTNNCNHKLLYTTVMIWSSQKGAKWVSILTLAVLLTFAPILTTNKHFLLKRGHFVSFLTWVQIKCFLGGKPIVLWFIFTSRLSKWEYNYTLCIHAPFAWKCVYLHVYKTHHFYSTYVILTSP